MRDILFRGFTKRPITKDGENLWVYGDLVKSGDKTYIKPKAIGFSVGVGDLAKLVVMHEVEPETVGQYTGLRDSNYKRLFEGDVVRNQQGTAGVVEWQKSECRFLVNIGGDWLTMDDCTYEICD